MIIPVARTHTIFRRRGYCTNFCLVCRDFQPCLFIAVADVKKLHVIPLERAKHKFFAGRCHACRTVMAYIDDEDAFSFSRKPSTESLELTACTHNAREIDERLWTERQLEAGEVSVEQRRAMLNDLAGRLRYTWAFECERGAGVSMAAVATVIGGFSGIGLLTVHQSLPRVVTMGWWVVLSISLVLTVLGLGYAGYVAFNRRRRVLRGFVLHRLAAGSMPLRLRIGDIEAVWRDARDPKDKWNVAAALEPAEVWSEMERIGRDGTAWNPTSAMR